MYERTNIIKNQNKSKINTLNNIYYSNKKSSLLNYNKNFNCIKGNKNIYIFLKNKINSQKIKFNSNLNHKSHENLTSNNSYRKKSYLNNSKNNNTKNIHNINQSLWEEKRNNEYHINILYSTVNGFQKNKKENIRPTINSNINNCNDFNNFLNILKQNKINSIINNLKNEFGAIKFTNNNINNQKLLYKGKDNKINNKSSINKSFNLNINKKNMNYIINNYLNTINNNCYDKKYKSKNLNKYYKINNKYINNSFSNNYISLKTNENKSKENFFYNNISKNK